MRLYGVNRPLDFSQVNVRHALSASILQATEIRQQGEKTDTIPPYSKCKRCEYWWPYDCTTTVTKCYAYGKLKPRPKISTKQKCTFGFSEYPPHAQVRYSSQTHELGFHGSAYIYTAPFGSYASLTNVVIKDVTNTTKPTSIGALVKHIPSHKL